MRLPLPVRPLAVTALACAALVALQPVGATRATAAGTTPTTPAFSAVIDNYARYEPEDTCDPTAKPGAVDLQALLKRTYGSGIGSNVSRSCSSSDSGHEEGRAIDWMTDSRDSDEKATAEAFLKWLLATDAYGNKHAMARRLGVMYLIWNSKKYYMWDTSAGWTEYSDCVSKRTSKSYDNTCHRNHVHISMSWAGAERRTSWWTWKKTAGCDVPGPSTSLTLTPSGPVRTVPATTVFDSAAGVGTPAPGMPCLASASSLLRVEPGLASGVPDSDVAEVSVRVTVSKSTTSTWVQPHLARGTVVAVGASAPVRRLDVKTGATGTVSWTLPLGAAQALWLQMGPAAATVRVEVLGWRSAADSAEDPQVGGGRVVAVPTPGEGEDRSEVAPVPARTVVVPVRPHF